MRDRGMTRGGGMNRGRGQHYNRHRNPGGQFHHYQQRPYPPGYQQNTYEPGNPLISPRPFGPHGHPRFRSPGPGPPPGAYGPQHTWTRGHQGPHHHMQRPPPPPQYGENPRAPPPPKTWLNTTSNNATAPWSNTGEQYGSTNRNQDQTLPPGQQQYCSTGSDYRGSNLGWGQSPLGSHGGHHGARGGYHHRGPRHGTKRRGCNNSQGRPKKPRKLDSVPQSHKNFYCEICDKGFQRRDQFQVHLDNHMKCPHEGCSYEAAPKLIKLHDAHQHKTGLANKIWNKKSEEDIAKWIAERKRCYPTAANIARKEKRLKTQIARGEVLETKQFGKMGGGKHHKSQANRILQWYKGKKSNTLNKDNKESNMNNKGRRRGTRGGARVKKKANRNQKSTSSTPVDLKLTMSDPLAYVVSSGEEESGEEKEEKGSMSLAAEISTMSSNKTTEQPVQLAGGLGSLLSAYGDNSNEDSDGSVEEGEVKDQQPVKSEPLRLPKNEDKPSTPQNTHNPKYRRNRRDNRTSKRKATLLQMLLAPDIRHERNVVLQCIRHVVNRNFYGIGAERSNSEITQRTNSDTAQPVGCSSDKDVTITKNNDEKHMDTVNYDADEIWDDVNEDFS